MASDVNTKDEETKSMIIFVNGILPQDLATFVKSNDITMDSFTVKMEIDDQTITSEYVINKQASFEELWYDFSYLQNALLKDGQASFAKSKEKSTLVKN